MDGEPTSPNTPQDIFSLLFDEEEGKTENKFTPAFPEPADNGDVPICLDFRQEAPIGTTLRKAQEIVMLDATWKHQQKEYRAASPEGGHPGEVKTKKNNNMDEQTVLTPPVKASIGTTLRKQKEYRAPKHSVKKHKTKNLNISQLEIAIGMRPDWKDPINKIIATINNEGKTKFSNSIKNNSESGRCPFCNTELKTKVPKDFSRIWTRHFLHSCPIFLAEHGELLREVRKQLFTELEEGPARKKRRT
eukprot:jgi/Bigna1/146363/aug1.113_g21071